MTTGISAASAALDDDEYQPMLDAITHHFAGVGGPLFTTEAEGLWEAYLAALPADQRQHHNCHACRRFVEHFGGLVYVDEHGATISAVFGEAPGIYGAPFRICEKIVEKARITGVFLSSLRTWGLSENADPKRGRSWRHMSIKPPPARVFVRTLKDPSEVMAEKREDYRILCTALADFDEATLTQAQAIVGSESLFRGEKVVEHLRWVAALHRNRREMRGRARDNVTWVAVAEAPAGWCHIRSSMIGTLLEDVAAGHPPEVVKRKWDEKMSPLQYRRPTAAPSAANIAQAEKAIAALNSAGALARRFAKLDELRALWMPTPPTVEKAEGGVFSHLKPKPRTLITPVKAPSMTWEKFQRTVLPEAQSMQCRAPSIGNYLAFVTAVNPEAPPILQWDSLEERNQVSWYLYAHGSPAANWGLTAGSYVPVTALSLLPFMWGERRGADHGEGVAFLLKGCLDKKDSGIGLFPEILRSEYHSVRATIEAYSNGAELGGREDASACGLLLRKGGKDGIAVRVTMRDGSIIDHTIDRWD